MGDPNWRYDSYADTGSIPRPSFHGYLSSEPSTLTTHPLRISNNLGSGSSDYVQKDIISSHPGGYAVDAYNSFAVLPEPGIGGFTAEASNRGYLSPLQDPNLLSQRQGNAIGTNHGIPDVTKERPVSFRKAENLPFSASESNILFVDGLPKDCSRREVGHLFRPFIGFRDIRVVHKEPRRSGDKAMVLCFVEFTDVKCALTALEALQGYKFDDKKTDSPVLKIQFAHFPFRLPSERGDHQFGRTC